MEVANLVLEFAKVLAWPAVVLALIFILRKRLGGLVDRVSSVEALGANLTFNESVQSASQELEEIRSEGHGTAEATLVSLVADPRIAQAADSVLAMYPIWPRLYRGGETPEVRVSSAWDQLVSVLIGVKTSFVEVDPFIGTIKEPVVLLGRLADITGLPAWKELAEALDKLRPDLAKEYPYRSFTTADLVMRPLAEAFTSRRATRVSNEYVDAIDAALLLVRGLLERTSRAHTVTAETQPSALAPEPTAPDQ